MGPPAARDDTWFTTMYAAHYAQIVKYAYRRLGEPDAAVELAQEVFVVAWRRRGDVPTHSLPWLYGVARRVLANRVRATRSAPSMVPLPDAEQLPVHAHLQGHERYGHDHAALAEVRTALAGLSELDQEILRLVGWEELDLAEAATVLGCTRPTAAVRLHRARRRLAAALARPTPTAAAVRPVAARS